MGEPSVSARAVRLQDWLKRMFRRAKRLRHRRSRGAGVSWRAMPVEELARIEALPRDWPGLGRLRWALWLNAVAPGIGLIALQRPRLGLILAGGFCLSAEIALLGVLVMPLSLGAWAETACFLAASFWIVAQVVLLRRMSDLQDPQLRLYASSQIEQARHAVAADEWAEAAALLAQAGDYDDEQPDLNWLLAKVQTVVGPHNQAWRQWRRLDQVDRRGRYEMEIRYALSEGARQGGSRAD